MSWVSIGQAGHGEILTYQFLQAKFNRGCGIVTPQNKLKITNKNGLNSAAMKIDGLRAATA
jgi:hypothetical protein